MRNALKCEEPGEKYTMLLQRYCCVVVPRHFCSWRSLAAVATALYTLAFLYSVTNSHYRVLYLSPLEIFDSAHSARHTRARAHERALEAAEYGRSRKILQNEPANKVLSYADLLRPAPRPTAADRDLPHCKPPLQDLRYVRVNPFQELNMTDVVHENPTVRRGRWRPRECRSVQRVAVIVPHRNREHHLTLLLHRLHPMLQLQQLEYRVFVIEQLEPEDFNRGMLLNVGFLEALALDPSFDCFVFQDVDLIPEHFQNLYMCTDHIHHLASAIDEMRFHVMFYNYAGGVVAVNKRNFIDVNGYANNYWGWGNEVSCLSLNSSQRNALV